MPQKSYKKLKQYCYFSHLSDAALKSLSKKLQDVEYPAGTEIIKEGAPADAFYLIRKGEVEVLKKTKWGQEAPISASSQGEGFGEMALLTCSPRFCSVTARTNVHLLKLDKSAFEEIVRADSAFAGMMVERHQSFYRYNDIKTTQPFALLQPEQVAAISGRLKEQSFAPGDHIITQGETGDTYYIIKSGKAEVLKESVDNGQEKVAAIEEGEGFGEEALITDSPRSATVRAVDETVVWTLSREDFDAVAKASFLKEVEPDDVPYSEGGQLNYLDVRMKSEFDEEHIPGAVNIPLDELRRRYAEFDRNKEYHVYCLMGARSATAAFLMNSQGLNTKSIKGGILNWPGPIEKGNDGVHKPFKPT